jgi:hypothetical protein
VLRPLDTRQNKLNSKCQWEILTDPFKVVTVELKRELENNNLDIAIAYDIAGIRNPKYYDSSDFYNCKNTTYIHRKERVLRVIISVQLLSKTSNYTITVNQTDPVPVHSKFIEERDGKIIIDEQLLVDGILWLIIFALIVGVIVTIIVYMCKFRRSENYLEQNDAQSTVERNNDQSIGDVELPNLHRQGYSLNSRSEPNSIGFRSGD